MAHAVSYAEGWWGLLMFRDREDAAAQLAQRLKSRPLHDPLVLAIPRGGVVIGAALAHELGAEFDVVLARKLRAPSQPELAIGAVSEAGELHLNRHADEMGDGFGGYLSAERDFQMRQMAQRGRLLREARPPAVRKGRSVIMTDDGIATGSTTIAALKDIRLHHPRELIVAVPVAAPDSLEAVRSWCDDVVCLLTPPYFYAVGAFYESFDEVDDDVVVTLLRESASYRKNSVHTRMAANVFDEVEIPCGDSRLHGLFALPANARGLVVFSHGSGSSRFSPRNKFVAESLQRADLGTLLIDLLTKDEEKDRGNVFDIDLLADRLQGAADWLGTHPETRGLPIGYFGASTGAASALVAAARQPERIKAIVSRGGRPDLADKHLGEVKSPALLIVGAEDEMVLQLNQAAIRQMNCVKELKIVPGATHLFEEPGALEEVARLANEWFRRYLAVE
jgi:putative phosphoribosyl transferase